VEFDALGEVRVRGFRSSKGSAACPVSFCRARGARPGGCSDLPMGPPVIAALGAEIPRQSSAIRHGFTDAVRVVMKRIASLIPGRRKSEDDALAIVATMAGALILARGRRS
jgi:hypothetical protein